MAMDKSKNKLSMEELTSYAKRRGFVFQASEIYGGLGGFWDLGPYGAALGVEEFAAAVLPAG